MSAEAAHETLTRVLAKSRHNVGHNGTTLIPYWMPEFSEELHAACRNALAAGVDPCKAFPAVLQTALDDVHDLPWSLEKLFIEGGLSPDADITGETLLHRLLQMPRPPAIKGLDICTAEIRTPSAPAKKDISGREAADPAAAAAVVEPLATTLDELLTRKVTPDLQDSNGNTALHLVVACMIQRIHFPDSSAIEIHDATARGQEVSGEDHDAERAQYASAAFTQLLEAGWTVDCPNSRGHTPVDLLAEGVRRYREELEDLVNPVGPAQTMVALLSQKAPEKQLGAYLDRKIAAMEKAVAALEEMYAAARARERPKEVKTAVSLVGLWLALLALCAAVLVYKVWA